MKVSEEMALNELKATHALLEGHFILSSGKHSGNYCQCAQLLRYADRAEIVLSRVADQVRESGITITKVCGPAMGAILVAYELGRQLGVENIFTERDKVTDAMCLRRNFSVDASDTILVVEDAITTGKSTRETIVVLESYGAKVVALGCIADRRTASAEPFPFPVFSAVKLSFPAYDECDCPICKEGKIPAVHPGSRRV